MQQRPIGNTGSNSNLNIEAQLLSTKCACKWGKKCTTDGRIVWSPFGPVKMGAGVEGRWISRKEDKKNVRWTSAPQCYVSISHITNAEVRAAADDPEGANVTGTNKKANVSWRHLNHATLAKP